MRHRTFIAIAALICGCAHSMVENGQIRQRDLRRMMARTAATRGLPLPDHLETRVVRHDQLAALLRQLFLDEWSEAELRDAQRMMTAMGLWPRGLDLLDESIRIQGGETAGLYSPTRRTLYLIEGAQPPEIVARASAISGRDLYAEFVLSHEIVHALQHQAFPQLFELTSEWKDQDDAVFALHAAIEGDALRYGLEVIAPDTQVQSAELFVQVENAEQAAENLGDAPAVLRYSLLFPYVSGYPLALTEAKRLLASPPVSTEQALHADKRREPFWSISLKAARARLPAGCEVLGENTMGEFLVSVLLRDLASETDAAAWQGWDGDRYLVALCGGRQQFVWLSSWDSERDAQEFQTAYEAMAGAVAARADLDAPPRVRRTGDEVVVFTAGLTALAGEIDRDAVRTRVADLGDLVAVAGDR